MRNQEITQKQNLLRSDGSLMNPGWSRSLIQTYHPNHIKAPSHRIKEWDYYLILTEDFACGFTIADLAYMGMISVSLLDFQKNWQHTETLLTPFPMGRMNLPSSSETGDVSFVNDRIHLQFRHTETGRRILCDFQNFKGRKSFRCDLSLEQPEMDSMVIATPWKEKPTAFYYNQKINCMPAHGTAQFDGTTYTFHKENSFGTLDWGRGVWTYDNTWYWGSGNGIIKGKPFGFNIGYGFGDTSAASENILFYDGVGHKLDDVYFLYDPKDFLKPWRFVSSDGRFETTFQPLMDRASVTNVKFLVSDQHQVFGRMSGQVILDDGTPLPLENLLCFAEKVHNRY